MTAVPAPPIPRCRRCHREMDSTRQVYCGTGCIAIDDTDAARMGAQLAMLRRQYDEETAAIEADIARYASERRRVLFSRRSDLDTAAAQLAPIQARLDTAKACGEIRFNLQSDHPADHGWV